MSNDQILKKNKLCNVSDYDTFAHDNVLSITDGWNISQLTDAIVMDRKHTQICIANDYSYMRERIVASQSFDHMTLCGHEPYLQQHID